MIQKIKNLVLVSMTGFMMFAPAVLIPAASHAAIKDSLCSGSTAASGEGCQSTGGDVEGGLKDLASDITRWFTIIVGALSIIMIIFGGFRYITSGGDSGRVGSAKNTIIYAIIGLIIVALAQIIVNVVLKVGSDTGTEFNTP